MLISFLYLALRKPIELVALRPRSAGYEELEIVVLRHELAILRRQVSRPHLEPADRVFLAAAARLFAPVALVVVTVDTVTLRRIYVLFFIELSNRRVHLAGITEKPDGPWVAQQARNLSWELSDREIPLRFLIRDNDAKFTRGFDEVFRSEGIDVIRTPVEAPKANAIAERFVGTARRQCLDWLLIANRGHLERVLRTFVDPYNGHRPHQALSLAAPDQANVVPLPSRGAGVSRRDRLGGLIHEYRAAA